MKKRCFRLLFLLVPLFFCAAQGGEGLAGRLSSISGSLSAAHISLASGTRIRVTNLETGRSIVVIVSRRLNANSGHIVELTVPAAEAIGLMNEARVRVEPLNSDGTPAPAAAPPPPVSAGGGVREPPATNSPNAREVPGTQSSPNTGTPPTRDSPSINGRSGEQRPLPAVQPAPPPSRSTGGPETGNEPGYRGFYYTNSYEEEYSGDLEKDDSPPSRESGLSPADIVTLPPETDRPAAPLSAVPSRSRPVPPPSASLAQARSGPPAPQAQPDPPALALPPAQTQPVPPPPASSAQARPNPPAPVPPTEARPVPPPPASSTPVRPADPASRDGAPARTAPPAAGRGAASARVALPADTDRVVLSMNRDESGKLWVYVESETAREVAVTEIPRQALARQQTAPPRQAPPAVSLPRTQAQIPAPPSQMQMPVSPPPPVQAPAPPPPPQRRQVTVTVIPRLPPAGDGRRYILQAGSYRERSTAESLLFSLQNLGIAAAMESQGASIRVVINGVYAEDIPALAEKMGRAGVTEIWVRER
ncbi:MAG: hypothetical protein LBK05_00530 [Treponema sp.]|nr:hypothetical protein [Treponema sp.]